MGIKTAPIQHLVARNKLDERRALTMYAKIMEQDYWPLRQGYNAAERGQAYDHHQTADWQQGWRLWQRRHGKAA